MLPPEKRAEQASLKPGDRSTAVSPDGIDIFAV
jgi:hypothetical protein